MIRSLYSLFPPATRRAIRLQQRLWQDIRSGHRQVFVHRTGAKQVFPKQLVVVQRVCPSSTLEAKLHNIQKALDLLQHLVVPPGEILSFWHIVGEPGRRQGFLPGRNIINGHLVHDYGGGLCQISSAMYELALRSGMRVLERHAHSTNVYTPETTYTPLGLDCTLAYGYKDLRLQNQFTFPVCFSFQLSATDFSAALCAPQGLAARKLLVEHEQQENGLYARVFMEESGQKTMISRDFYKAWQADDL